MSDVQNSGSSSTPPHGQDASHSQGATDAEHAPDSPPASPSENQEQTRPWYARPWFWAILAFLAILAVLAWLFWHQWQAHLARLQHDQALVLQQQERNADLEAEIARLQALLLQDPCSIKEQLPSIGEPLRIPPHAEGTQMTPSPASPPQAPQANAPAHDDAKNAQGTNNPAEAPPPPPLQDDTATATPPSKDFQEPSMAQKLEDATVLVLSEEPSGLQMGTGFFIAPGIVLTNQHVVGSGKGTIYVVGTFKGTATKAKVLIISPDSKRDYAVLQVPVTDVAPLKLTTQVERTQKVSTWGFPSAVTDNDPKFKNLMNGTDTKAPDVIYSEGTVSVIQEQNPSLIVHTAIVSQGNSGGPLVNEQGDVVGINTYIHMDKQSYRQSSLSIVTQDIIKFLQEHSLPFTLSSGHKE